jgi:hypothetical protein
MAVLAGFRVLNMGFWYHKPATAGYYQGVDKANQLAQWPVYLFQKIKYLNKCGKR